MCDSIKSRRRRLRPSGWKLRAAGGALAGLTAGGLVQVRAQGFFNPFGATLPAGMPAFAGEGGAGDNFQITRGVPYNPAVGGGGGHPDYNFKLGSVTGTLGASLAANFNDNYNQVPDGSGLKQEYDLTLNPMLGLAFRWPINHDNTLNFDVGVGYSFSVNHPQFDRLTISPSSSWNYQFRAGEVRFTVFDRLGTSGTSGASGQFTGTGSASAVQFNRLSNSTGLSAAWQPTQHTTISAGYSVDLDYGISDSFAFSDHVTQSLSLAMFQRLNAHWTLGVSGSVYMNDYLQGIQNNSTGYGAGPTMTWQPSRFLNFSASVRYNVANAQHTGIISDTGGSGGLGYDFSVQHTVNRRFNHGVSFSSGFELGVGANFNQTFTIAYRAGWNLTQRIALSATVNRQSLTQSGASYLFTALPAGDLFVPAGVVGPPGILAPPGVFQPLPAGSLLFGQLIAIPQQAESADIYNFTLGTSFALTRKLSTSVGYGHILKASNLPLHDYNQNTVSVSLSYRF
jgi:hypothetical protein